MAGFAVHSYIHGFAEQIKIILGKKQFLNVFNNGLNIFCKTYGSNCEETEEGRYLFHSVQIIVIRLGVYIGQTKRQFRTRLKEHHKAVFFSKKKNSALSVHACVTNPKLLPPRIHVTIKNIVWRPCILIAHTAN